MDLMFVLLVLYLLHIDNAHIISLSSVNYTRTIRPNENGLAQVQKKHIFETKNKYYSLM